MLVGCTVKVAAGVVRPPAATVGVVRPPFYFFAAVFPATPTVGPEVTESKVAIVPPGAKVGLTVVPGGTTGVVRPLPFEAPVPPGATKPTVEPPIPPGG